MNNNLKELAEKSGLYTDSSGRWVHYDSVVKFAEILVKECSQLANYNNHGIDGSRKILETFGIKNEQS